jgi:hypothetical protein
MSGNAFSGVEASGPLAGKIELFLPFKDFASRRILVHAKPTAPRSIGPACR